MKRACFLQTLSLGALIVAAQLPASATSLTLTTAGIADGFSLTTFVSGYNFGTTYGPISQGISMAGQVITGSSGDGEIYVFNDTDNQTLANAVYSTVCPGCGNFAMASVNGQVYGAQVYGGAFGKFSSDGTFTPISGLAGITNNLGMWADPVNGHLIAASSKGLVDIDPVAGTYRLIAQGNLPDGVTISADGQTIIAATAYGWVETVDYTTGRVLSTFSNSNDPSPDGVGVITGGTYNGNVIINDNNGSVSMLDLSNGTYTLIATGGTRGDWVSSDTNNGSLFVAETNAVYRLSCAGCDFSGASPTPEPAAFWLILPGLAVLGGRRSLITGPRSAA